MLCVVGHCPLSIPGAWLPLPCASVGQAAGRHNGCGVSAGHTMGSNGSAMGGNGSTMGGNGVTQGGNGEAMDTTWWQFNGCVTPLTPDSSTVIAGQQTLL